MEAAQDPSQSTALELLVTEHWGIQKHRAGCGGVFSELPRLPKARSRRNTVGVDPSPRLAHHEDSTPVQRRLEVDSTPRLTVPGCRPFICPPHCLLSTSSPGPLPSPCEKGVQASGSHQVLRHLPLSPAMPVL